FPRPRIHRRIFERGFVLNRIRINARVPLDDVERGTGEVPGHIEPRLAVEIRRVHDERIALPPPHRVAGPERHRGWNMSAAVGPPDRQSPHPHPEPESWRDGARCPTAPIRPDCSSTLAD